MAAGTPRLISSPGDGGGTEVDYTPDDVTEDTPVAADANVPADVDVYAASTEEEQVMRSSVLVPCTGI